MRQHKRAGLYRGQLIIAEIYEVVFVPYPKCAAVQLSQAHIV